MTVGGREMLMMLDSGARYSTCNQSLPASKRVTSVIGIAGQTQFLPFSKDMDCDLAGIRFSHSFLLSPTCPLNLIGRDILIKAGANMMFTKHGTVVQFPNGVVHHCSSSHTDRVLDIGAQLAATNDFDVEDDRDFAAVYWLLLSHTDTIPPSKLFEDFELWKPWIFSLYPLEYPADPPHCTLNYDLFNNDLDYETDWEGMMDILNKNVTIRDIYVSQEGVAASVSLDCTQEQLYALSKDSAPHVTLAVKSGGEARALGPMVKRCIDACDWQHGPKVSYSPSCKAYMIPHSSTSFVVPEKVLRHRTHGRENTNHPDSDDIINAMPASLWSTGPADVGKLQIPPIKINLKPDTVPIWKYQYPLSREKIDGIRPVIEDLLRSGVLRQTVSDWNTPILPTPKPGKNVYRMVHDLRPINQVVLPSHCKTPNPFVMLTSITPDHKFFTVIDLANAFFSVPLHEDCQNIFAFTYENSQFSYTVLPQGLKNSPSLFNNILKTHLSELTPHLPPNTVILQYVDDILIAAPSTAKNLQATSLVLHFLATKGYKVSKDKLQICRPTVHYLGRLITSGATSMSPEHKSSILNHPKPNTGKSLLSFLGLTGYSKQFVPNYQDLVSPLRALIRQKGYANLNAPLHWTPEAEICFTALKQALAQATQLNPPDYSLPFHLDVSEQEGTVKAVLYQKQGGTRTVLMYYSSKLDNVEIGHPPCTRHCAAIAKALIKTAHIVMQHTVHVHTNHGVAAFLDSTAFTLSTKRQQKLKNILDQPNVLYTSEGVNMAAEISTQGEPHDCAVLAETDMKIVETLTPNPIENPDLVLFCDGSSRRRLDGTLSAAYAVVKLVPKSQLVTIEATHIGNNSAQKAEIMGLTAALNHAHGKTVNIYTDSAYAHHAVYVDLPHWSRKGFVTATGTPIKHLPEIIALQEALSRPKGVAVLKCKGHQSDNTIVAKGNAAADESARRLTEDDKIMVVRRANVENSDSEEEQEEQEQEKQDLNTVHDDSKQQEQMTEERIRELQAAAGAYEYSAWTDRGAVCTEGLWRSADGRLVAPTKLLHMLCKEAHYKGHVGHKKIMSLVKHLWWHPYLEDIAKLIVQECGTCQKYNPKTTLKATIGSFPAPTGPWQEIVIDFTDMGSSNRHYGYRYLLVCVDVFSRWVEAIPTRTESAKAVVKWLTKELIPRYGVPSLIRSDNGTHFSNKHLQDIETFLGIKHKFGSVYHAASQGITERANGTLKRMIAKQCHETKMNWVDALPLALMAMRSTVCDTLCLSPHEVLTGRKMPGPFVTSPVTVRPQQGHEMSDYVDALNNLALSISQQVTDVLSKDTESDEGVVIRPGDWVLQKTFKINWDKPRWQGPYQVAKSQSHSLQVWKGEKLSNWIHVTHCAKTSDPTKNLSEVK